MCPMAIYGDTIPEPAKFDPVITKRHIRHSAWILREREHTPGASKQQRSCSTVVFWQEAGPLVLQPELRLLWNRLIESMESMYGDARDEPARAANTNEVSILGNVMERTVRLQVVLRTRSPPVRAYVKYAVGHLRIRDGNRDIWQTTDGMQCGHGGDSSVPN